MQQGLTSKVLESLLTAAAAWIGIRVGQELLDPTSDIRLRLAELGERLQEVRRQ